MIIGTCGFTSTGSSAVSDFLKEFNSVSTLDRVEFVISYYPDGLEDLDYQINKNCSKYSASTIAIERFKMHVYNYLINRHIDSATKMKLKRILEEFVNSIVQVSWDGFGSADFQLYSGRHYKSRLNLLQYRIGAKAIVSIEKFLKKPVNIFPVRKLQFSVLPENFEENARRFIHRIIEVYGGDFTKPIVIDQPFSGNNPEKSFKFFEDPIAIVVDRDPRDVYLFIKVFLRGIGHQTPTQSVEAFIEYYRRMRDNQPYKTPNDRVLCINFEDMIYEYEATTTLICNFCGLSMEDRTRKIFDPSLSINNTQLFKKYKGYESDIEKIEASLSDYLYPFEKYGDVNNNGTMFYGKSPLNK